MSQRQWFVDQALNDTGFFARRVLGHDGDKMLVKLPNGQMEQREGVNRPHGGIRATGEHKRITEFVDNLNGRNKLLLAPRGSYKSTILTSFCARMVIRNPKVRIFYGMHTMKEAIGKVMAIRDALAQNETIKQYWGDQRGSVWRQDRIKVAGSDPNSQTHTIEAFGLDKPKTGGHPDIIIGDDLVQEENSNTPEGLEKTKDVIRMMSPLLNNGGILMLAGTRYAHEDAYNWIMTEKADDYDVLSIDAGVQIHRDEIGRYILSGAPTFPHLSLETLAGHLRRMDVAKFTSQYLNRIDTGVDQAFERHHFRPTVVGKNAMQTMTGYLFIDTALTVEADSCYTVLAYGAFTTNDDFILLDLDVGQWAPDETAKHYVAMLAKWQGRIYHRGELMEVTDANYVFKTTFETAATLAGLRAQLRFIRRPKDSVNKEKRIRGLTPRFRNQKFLVNSTVPRTYRTHKGEQVLWDAEGYYDRESGLRLPGGFLVDSFVGFPTTQHRDIPDALADMDRDDETGTRYASYCTPAHIVAAMHKPAAPSLPSIGTRFGGQRESGMAGWAKSKLR